jgi:hypothetical protein
MLEEWAAALINNLPPFHRLPRRLSLELAFSSKLQTEGSACPGGFSNRQMEGA